MGDLVHNTRPLSSGWPENFPRQWSSYSNGVQKRRRRRGSRKKIDCKTSINAMGMLDIKQKTDTKDGGAESNAGEKAGRLGPRRGVPLRELKDLDGDI